MNLNLALFKRALLLDSRRFILYGTWLLMGVLLTIFLYSYTSIRQALSSGVKGLHFLESVAQLNYYFIVLAGIFGFSSAITEEKEEETIGLLIMTGISPLNLILSKAGARLIRGLFLIASQIPFTIFAVTLGGVSSYQVSAVYVTLISFMFMLTFLCTFISLMSATTRYAATLSFIVLIAAFFLGLFLIEWDVIEREYMVLFFPALALNQILETGFSEYYHSLQLTSCLSQGVLFFLLSLFYFDKFALKAPKQTVKKKKVSKQRRSWNMALAWKEFTFHLGGKKSWLIQGLIFLFALILAIYNSASSYRMEENIALTIFWTSFCLTLILMTIAVSIMFSGEFKRGTHSCLFTLPYEHQNLFLGKAAGAFIFLAPSFFTASISLTHVCSKYGAPPIEAFLTVFSFIFVFMTATAYFSLVMRIAGFIVAGVVIFVTYFILGIAFLSSLRSGDAVAFICIFLNTIGGISFVFMANGKLIEKKSR